MFSLLELKNFKCFELLKLPLGKLTVLSGTNASGKSSVLQSIVLLHQAMRENEWSHRLALNGSSIQLGTMSDVVDQVNGGDRFEIAISNEDSHLRWRFSGVRRDMSAQLEEINGETSSGQALRWLLSADAVGASLSMVLGIRDLAYITAERDGPREVYQLVDEYSVQTVGPRGEYAVSVLFQGQHERIADEMSLAGIPPTLYRQVEARMDAFFPGCRLEMQQVQNVNAATLRIRISEETDFLRPIHCGFGITQVLPIVVAILASRVRKRREEIPADANDRLVQILSHSDTASPLILIENPEVHLHPAGQAQIGAFLAEAAQAGVQIIVETHSDHVLNGIRRAVKSGQAKADDVAIHFFRDRFSHESQVLSPVLDQSGNIDVWPEGFFDQFDKDLNYFAGWGE